MADFAINNHSFVSFKWAHVWRSALFAVVPVADFCLMESFGRNPFAQIRPDAFLYNVILFEITAWVLWLLSGRPRISLSILTVLSLVWGLANHYVYDFRSTPLMPWDFYSIRTAASVADNYDFALDRECWLVIGGFVCLLAAIWLDRIKSSHRKRTDGRKGFVMRLGMAAVLTAMAIGLCVNLQDEDFQNRHNLYPFLFTPNVLIKYNGIAVSFVMEAKYLWVEKPEGYDPDQAEALLQSYDTADAPDEGPLPTIIAIMDEAFSDLSVLGDFPVSEDYMPFVHRMMDGAENTVSGTLNVSVCGGNTANTEFEFLTGNSMAFLPAGSIPYQQYIRRQLPSLASVLKEKGYATYAQHPYYGSGWERERIYPLLGFEDMDFIHDYRNRSKVRSYVDDQTCFDHIIETFENKPADKPAFIFNVTMQNHGGYTDTKSGFSNTVTAEGLKSQPLNQYLSLLRLTDEKLEQLVDYFRLQDEPVILVFFGDHQPNNTVAGPVMKWALQNGSTVQSKDNEGESQSAEEEGENPLRYQVPYFIWANFDLEEQTGVDTSANYLGNHLLRLAGLDLSPYQKFLEEQEKTLPILSAVQGDVDLAEEYQKLQYYLMFGRK